MDEEWKEGRKEGKEKNDSRRGLRAATMYVLRKGS
jgi:hypothetical protein